MSLVGVSKTPTGQGQDAPARNVSLIASGRAGRPATRGTDRLGHQLAACPLSVANGFFPTRKLSLIAVPTKPAGHGARCAGPECVPHNVRQGRPASDRRNEPSRTPAHYLSAFDRKQTLLRRRGRPGQIKLECVANGTGAHYFTERNRVPASDAPCGPCAPPKRPTMVDKTRQTILHRVSARCHGPRPLHQTDSPGTAA